MFTGLIQTIGVVHDIRRESDLINLVIEASFADKNRDNLKIGDSVAVSGICLTVTQLQENRFETQAMKETVSKTTLGAWQKGTRVNLECALKASGKLNGHMVSGHVDGRAVLRSLQSEGKARRLEFQTFPDIHRYIARKGSIALDGVSLTVVDVLLNNRFTVGLIPHTLTSTTMGSARPGKEMNVEVDLIARYIERIIENKPQASGLTLEKLAEHGF